MEDQEVNKENKNTENKELILELEKQVSVASWIQFFGQIAEAISLSKIMFISEEERMNPNKHQILLGAWLQAIGQFIIGIGVSKQVASTEEVASLEAEELTNMGDWIKTLGSTVEAQASRQVIIEEKNKLEPPVLIP